MTTTDVVFPRLDQGMTSGVLVAWYVRAGDVVDRGQPIAEIETDKVTVAIESPASGVVQSIFGVAGEEVDVGTVVAVLGDSAPAPGLSAQPIDEQPDKIAPPRTETAASTRPTDQDVQPPAAESPQVSDIDLHRSPNPLDVHSRPLLTIDRRDVVRPHVASPRRRNVHGSPAASPEVTGRSRTVPFTTIQKSVIRTVEASLAVPQFEVSLDVPTAAVQELISQIRAHSQTQIKVGLTDVFLRAMAIASKAVPQCNAWFHENGLELFDGVDVNLLLDRSGDLLNPVITDVQSGTMTQVAAKRIAITDQVASGRVGAAQLTAGGMTLSNLGPLGIDRFKALIFPPQVVVLALGRARTEILGAPVTCTLTVDHRGVNGAQAARFLGAIGDCFLSPYTLLGELQ